MPDFLGRLRQRKVVQWSLAYCAGAWVLLQVVDLAAESYDWPTIVMRLLLGAAVLGLPIVLVLAWYHGDRGEQKASGTELLILSLLLAVGGGLLWNLERGHSGVLRDGEVLAAKPAIEPGTAPASEVDPRSIAVLPFANLSSDKDNGYFADGIQDEVLTRLAKIGALTVLSRTSTLRFASKPENLPDIARELGVANVVEGSVQKSGNSVRINVQLIRADSDTHLWAESYDRTLDNVFSVQSEVATAIAEALQATLTRDEQMAVERRGTSNPAAYDAYLRGLHMERTGQSTVPSQQSATRHFQKALRHDPDFVDALTHLVISRSFLIYNGVDDTPATRQEARDAVARVARLLPDSGEAALAEGYYRYRIETDLPVALAAFERAAARLPRNAEVLGALSLVERRLGRIDSALDHVAQAAEVEPGNLVWLSYWAEYLAAVRRFGEARGILDRALAMDPDHVESLAAKALAYQAEGNLVAAQASLDRLPPVRPGDILPLEAQERQLRYQRRFAALQAWVRPLAERTRAKGEAASLDELGFLATLGEAQAGVGDDQALESFRRLLVRTEAAEAEGINPGYLHSFRAVGHSGLGNHARALRAAKQHLTAAGVDVRNSASAKVLLAMVLAAARDVDGALAVIGPLLKAPYGITPADLRLNPVWDPLRKDPRFVSLSQG